MERTEEQTDNISFVCKDVLKEQTEKGVLSSMAAIILLSTVSPSSIYIYSESFLDLHGQEVVSKQYGLTQN